MFLKKMWKKIKKYRRVFYLIGIIAIIVIAIQTNKNFRNTTCSSLEIVILDSAKSQFITQNIILDFISENIEKNIIGNKFKNINLSKIEDGIKEFSYCQDVQVFRVSDGIKIEITQREPIVRIYDNNNNSFYIDIDGYVLPTVSHYASYVPIANGNISHYDTIFSVKHFNINDLKVEKNKLKDIFDLAVIIKNDKFMEANIDQIYISKSNNFELIPKVGNFTIILGKLENIEEKISTIKAYYSEVAPKLGWEKYSAISVAFSNQIVCTKR